MELKKELRKALWRLFNNNTKDSKDYDMLVDYINNSELMTICEPYEDIPMEVRNALKVISRQCIDTDSCADCPYRDNDAENGCLFDNSPSCFEDMIFKDGSISKFIKYIKPEREENS